MTRYAGDLVSKDPGSTEPFGIDWTDYLAELGEGVTISTSTWTISGQDSVLTSGNDSILSGSLKTQVFLAAGTLGGLYTVTNRITTSSSPTVTDERSFLVLVEQQ